MPLGLELLEPEIELAELGESPVPPPVLLIEQPSAPAVFVENLKNLLWKSNEPPLRLASKPGEFWPDVFVVRGSAWGRFFQSAGLHGLVAGLIWVAILVIPRQAQIAERPTFHKEDVIYYSAADYLPPLDTRGSRQQKAGKGEPALAPQPIISVPAEADNRTQTIVAPPDVKLSHDVPMPNVVALPQRSVAVPIEATTRTVMDTRSAAFNQQVVAPAPSVENASSRRSLDALQAAVVAPPPSVDASIHRRADLNIGRSEVVAPAPQLPMEAQRSLAAPSLGGSQSAVAPAPSVQPAGLASSGQRLIALGIHPIGATGPVEPPAGNRRGTFAAGPNGKAGAAGTPDSGGSNGPAGTKGSGNSGNGAGSSGRSDVPTGLRVGAAPGQVSSSAVGGGGGAGTGGGSSNNPFLLAKATPPRVSVPSSRTTEPAQQETEDEKKVFGDRKFYAMTVNMPNLNSAGGSWVIHFAERDEKEKGDLSAPHAIAIADPGYPLELMKQNIHGTVTLYAVIHSDGSVGDVRVLRGVDDQLDKYASDALARWHFHPATKNGSPVDLEAVVTIPFRPGRVRPSF